MFQLVETQQSGWTKHNTLLGKSHEISNPFDGLPRVLAQRADQVFKKLSNRKWTQVDVDANSAVDFEGFAGADSGHVSATL